jgi:FdhE protein
MNELQNVVHAAIGKTPIPTAGIPVWSDYLHDFEAGIPLLLSSEMTVNDRLVEKAFTSFVETLASKPLPAKLNREIDDLVAELKGESKSKTLIAWLLGDGTFDTKYPGLVRYLGWTLTARYLQPLGLAFARWREEECWLRNYCPMCGALPAMAQLVGDDPTRLRLLSCGCCATQWRYRRTGCPFCDAGDDSRLAVLGIEGEPRLRIDYCKTCGGYLKTCNGESSESVLLADWTSLHLDVIARDRGFRRCAASLYEL